MWLFNFTFLWSKDQILWHCYLQTNRKAYKRTNGEGKKSDRQTNRTELIQNDSEQLLEDSGCRRCNAWQNFPASGRPFGKTTKIVLRSARSCDTRIRRPDVSDVPDSVFRLFRKLLGSLGRGRPVRKELLFEPYLKCSKKKTHRKQKSLRQNLKNFVLKVFFAYLPNLNFSWNVTNDRVKVFVKIKPKVFFNKSTREHKESEQKESDRSNQTNRE